MTTADCVKIATINAAKDVVLGYRGTVPKMAEVVGAAEEYLAVVFKDARAECQASPARKTK